MELIDLHRELLKHFTYKHDAALEWGYLFFGVLDKEGLEMADEYFTKRELFLTEHELNLKSEVNRHICILLTKEEL